MPDTQLKGEQELAEFIEEQRKIWNLLMEGEWEIYIDRKLDERRELRGAYRV